MRYIFFLSLPLYLLDRVTKYLVLACVTEEPRIIIPDFFDIVNITNTGAAFGSFKNNNVLFIAISCIALFFALVLLLGHHREPTGEKSIWWKPRSVARSFAGALLLAGVLGNLTDRLLYGHVIDFLLFDFAARAEIGLHPWPAFQRGRFLHLHRGDLFYYPFIPA